MVCSCLTDGGLSDNSIASCVKRSALIFALFFFLFDAAGVPMEDKNWPPFFPIIHHDIANEIPANLQKLQYLAFASWLGRCRLDIVIAICYINCLVVLHCLLI